MHFPSQVLTSGKLRLPEDEASAGFLTEILCYQLEKCENCYIFIDDFHLLKDDRAATFLCRMAGRIPEKCASDRSKPKSFYQ